MFATVWRTIQVRVRPDILLIFRPFAPGEASGEQPTRGFLSRFRTSWAENYSLFSWADRGQWETVDTAVIDLKRQADWFRIGFEPVFVDYTKRGAWFMLFNLTEVRVCGGVRGRPHDLITGRSGIVCMRRYVWFPPDVNVHGER